MRLFFALRPPDGVRRAAAALQRRLMASGPARAVPEANFHVTLAFLGNVDSAGREAAERVAGPLPALTLRLDRLGVFPGAGVVWLGCSSVPGLLLRFQTELAAALEAAGFELDRRPWRPHLTLYRKMRTGPATIGFDAIEWPLDGWSLMQSRSGRRGVEYREIAHWPVAIEDDFGERS